MDVVCSRLKVDGERNRDRPFTTRNRVVLTTRHVICTHISAYYTFSLFSGVTLLTLVTALN